MIQATSLGFSYQNPGLDPVPVLENLTLSFAKSELSVVLGPSGCGKTTFLNIVAGIHQPTAGSIEFGVGSRAGRIGYVFQEPSLVPWRTISSNALLGAELSGRRDEAAARVPDLLRRYGLGGFEDSYPSALSGGMQQRVAIVRAMLADAEVLLLDEPFSNSDFSLRRDLQKDLSNAVDEAELTGILVTHDLEEAVAIADRLIVLTGRPARLKREIEIPIPRTERFGRKWGLSSELTPYLHKLWSVLEESE